MKTGTGSALLIVFAMAAVIFLCRIFPFLFFRAAKSDETSGIKRPGIIEFVEKTVPPLAMTILTFNALAVPVIENIRLDCWTRIVPVLAAAAFTVIAHLWRRNPLISIFGGTAVYMVLERIIP